MVPPIFMGQGGLSFPLVSRHQLGRGRIVNAHRPRANPEQQVPGRLSHIAIRVSQRPWSQRRSGRLTAGALRGKSCRSFFALIALRGKHIVSA